MASPLPGKLDIAAYRGDTKQWTLGFAEGDDPTDMSAWDWSAQVRANLDEPDDITATFDVDDGAAADGTLVLTLPADQSALLVTADGRATYYWDLQGTQGAVVKTWMAGKVKVTGDVTFGDV